MKVWVVIISSRPFHSSRFQPTMDAPAADGYPQGWPRGLTLLRDFVSEEEEASLVRDIDEMPWLSEIQRRTQQLRFLAKRTNK